MNPMNGFFQTIGYCGLLMILCWHSAYAEKITLVADEWCPYNCAADSAKPGFMIEIARHVFSSVGIEIDYQIVPWARAIQDARKGQYDGIVGAAKGDAPDFIFPEVALGIAQNCFYTKPSSRWSYTTLAELKKIQIGAIKDYSYGELLDNYIASYQSKSIVQVVAGNTALRQNIEKMLKGRIDAVLESKAVMNYFLSEHYPPNTAREAGCVDEVDKVYIAFSPAKSRSASLYAQQLTDGVRHLLSSGKLQSIFASYGLQDWQQYISLTVPLNHLVVTFHLPTD